MEALRAVDYLFRDRYTGAIRRIDLRLLDLLHAISVKTRNNRPFHIISGYRTPETNAMLRKKMKPAAPNSFHVKGMAADIRLPGCAVADLRRVAVTLKKGGVGFYPRSRFVHVDVGNVRYWRQT